jgi:hypothetical protein
VDYLNYVKNLKFDEKPNYNYLRRLFENLLTKNGLEMDYQYDWVIKKQQMIQEMSPKPDDEDENRSRLMGAGITDRRKSRI